MDARRRRRHDGPMTRTIDADYLVVGAGAMGMAFTDALTGHTDVRVALIDRRHSVSGHWLEAYPFVRLHQASAFYGVASTLLGEGQLQQRGPERGLQERASQPEICFYYARMLERFVESGRSSSSQTASTSATAPSSPTSRVNDSRCPTVAGS